MKRHKPHPGNGGGIGGGPGSLALPPPRAPNADGQHLEPPLPPQRMPFEPQHQQQRLHHPQQHQQHQQQHFLPGPRLHPAPHHHQPHPQQQQQQQHHAAQAHHAAQQQHYRQSWGGAPARPRRREDYHAPPHDLSGSVAFFEELEHNSLVVEGASTPSALVHADVPHHPHSAPPHTFDATDPGTIPPLKLSASASRKRPKPRGEGMSDADKKARHNAHTRSSRLRIDNGLDKLKGALKKVRPGLKLNKKADIVDEAVRLICDTHNINVSDADDDGEAGGSSLSV